MQANAPGKAVIAGEYAVLAGAPSLVMAVSRRAKCTIVPTESDVWEFTSSGFTATSSHNLRSLAQPELMTKDDPARLTGWVVGCGRPSILEMLPTGARVHTNTQEMYEGPNKLGLGSSAALITAVAGAISRLVSDPAPSFDAIHHAHQSSQQGVGSGLDVATSLTGGLIRFEDGKCQKVSWPENLHYRFIYSGKPASTPELVGRFNAWHSAAQKSRKIDPLSALFDASATLANGAINLDNLAAYIQALRNLDDAARIGIYTSEHNTISRAAERFGVLYKPCGAGGGDLGVAISDSYDELKEFTAEIDKNFAVIDLEIASHGLDIG